jgi:hypothetical protein
MRVLRSSKKPLLRQYLASFWRQMKATLRKDGRWQVRIPSKLSASSKRESRYFASHTQADKFIREWRNEQREHGRQVVTASERRWLGYWKERVGDLALMPEVVNFWKRSGEHLEQISASDAVGAFINANEAEYTNKRTWHDIEERLARFSAHFGSRLLHEVTVFDVESFLATYSSGWYRWGTYKRLKPFFKFAARRKWVAVDPMTVIPVPKTPTPERAIYSVDQFQALLWLAESKYEPMLPYVILAGFCYMRTAELVRMYKSEQVLQWSDVLWSDGLIHVRHGVAKGTLRASDERYVPFTDTARRWLEPIKGDGDCVPHSAKRFGELWRALTDEARVARIDNGLRHSAISYSLAADPQNGLALVAQWAGNSESTIRKHYRRLLKPDEGRKWFAIRHQDEPEPKEPAHGIYVGDLSRWGV